MDSPAVRTALASVAVAVACWRVARYWRSQRGGRIAAAFGAEQLAAIRILACGVLLTNTLWEDVASTSRLPTDLVHPMGLAWLVRQLPGIDYFYASAGALTAFQLVTALLLALAAVGWRTRATLPAATVCALILGGILREYSHLFHTCLLPLWIAGVLCFTPCADAWSFDRVRSAFRGQARSLSAPTVYGWSVVAVWTVVAGAYFGAGVSKLRDGGLMWFDPANIQRIFLQESLNPMEFDWGISLHLANAPATLFGVLGLAALTLELAYPSVLFSRTARRWIPRAVVGFHVGTFLLQNILFFDLIVLQLVFVDYAALTRRWRRWRSAGRRATVLYDGACPTCRRTRNGLRRLDVLGALAWVSFRDPRLQPSLRACGLLPADLDREMHVVAGTRVWRGFFAIRRIVASLPLAWPVVPLLYLPGARVLGSAVYRSIAARRRRDCSDHTCAVSFARAPRQSPSPARLRLVATALLSLSIVGALGIELYPLTSWQMFSGSDRSGVVEYYRVRQLDEHGIEQRADIERCFPSLRDGRYRRVLPMAFDTRQALLRRFLDACGAELARRGTPVREFVIEKWRWRFREHPADPRHGERVALYRHRL